MISAISPSGVLSRRIRSMTTSTITPAVRSSSGRKWLRLARLPRSIVSPRVNLPLIRPRAPICRSTNRRGRRRMRHQHDLVDVIERCADQIEYGVRIDAEDDHDDRERDQSEGFAQSQVAEVLVFFVERAEINSLEGPQHVTGRQN